MSQPRRGPKRKHYVVTFEPDVWERWTEIGLCEGFQSDSNVARFLLSLYGSAGGENGRVSDRRCVGCHTVLPLLCVKCQFPSCVAASSQREVRTQPKSSAQTTLSIPAMPSVQATTSVQVTPSTRTSPSVQAKLSVETMPSVQAMPSTQSMPFTQQTLMTQAMTSPQVSFAMQESDISEQEASRASVFTTVILTMSTSHSVTTCGLLATPQLPPTADGKVESEATFLPSDPVNPIEQNTKLTASQNMHLPSLSSSTDTAVGTSHTVHLEEDMDNGHYCEIIDDLNEGRDFGIQWGMYENKDRVTLQPLVEIQTDMAVIKEESVQLLCSDEHRVNDKHENAIKKDATCQYSGNDNNNITDILDREKSGPKWKRKKAKHSITKKENQKLLRNRLKEAEKKMDTVPSSQEGSRKDGNPANEKLVTYEPKTVLGKGKKIGRYFYYSDYVCACCDKVFSGKAKFNRHITEMKTHQEQLLHRKYKRRQKKCPECSQMVKLGQEFTQHMKRHWTPKLTCTECKAQFISKQEFARHVKAHQGDRPFLCTICGDGFKMSGHLSNHMVTHSTVRAFMCSVCGMSFKSAGILQGHEVTHTGERKFQCQQCGRNFARRHTLNMHILIHSQLKPFKCDQCDATFINKTKLRYHKTIHSTHPDFKCEECGTVFACPTSLRNHHRIHTGEKPCVCTVCDKTFARPAYLRNHMKFHSGEKPHKCKHCIRAFRKRQSLKHHLKTVHPEMCGPPVASDSISFMSQDKLAAAQPQVMVTYVDKNKRTSDCE